MTFPLAAQPTPNKRPGHMFSLSTGLFSLHRPCHNKRTVAVTWPGELHRGNLVKGIKQRLAEFDMTESRTLQLFKYFTGRVKRSVPVKRTYRFFLLILPAD